MPTTATRSQPAAWRAAAWTLPRAVVVAALLVPTLALPAFLGLQILRVPEVAPFLALFVVLAAANVLTRNRWVQLAGGLVAFAFAAMNIAFIYAELTRPDHYPMYFLAWLAVLGGATGLAAGVTGFRRARRESLPPQWASAGPALVLLALGFAAGTFVSTAGMRFSETPAPADVALTADATFELETTGFAFSPGTLEIPADRIVRIHLSNDDPETHTFTIDALGIDVDVASGKSSDVWLRAPAGTYQVYCKPHSAPAGGEREGMIGTLVVT